MMSRVITILEISQKQAYIYESNKLKDNIINSAVIAYVLSAAKISACGDLPVMSKAETYHQ